MSNCPGIEWAAAIVNVLFQKNEKMPFSLKEKKSLKQKTKKAPYIYVDIKKPEQVPHFRAGLFEQPYIFKGSYYPGAIARGLMSGG